MHPCRYFQVILPFRRIAGSTAHDCTYTHVHAWRRTLPSNLALCVNPDFAYVRAKDPATGKVYVVAESRLAFIPGAVPKAKKGGKGGDKKDAEPKGWQVSSQLT